VGTLEHKGYLTRADIGGKKETRDNAFYDVHAVAITSCPRRGEMPSRTIKIRPYCANAPSMQGDEGEPVIEQQGGTRGTAKGEKD